MADIRITNDDLQSAAIDDVLNLQKSLQQKQGDFVEDIKTPFHHNPVFYYSVAGLLGAIIGWAIQEPFFSDEAEQVMPFLSDYMLFGLTAGLIGMALGMVYGLSNRNLSKTLLCGAVGVGVGLAASVLTTFLAENTGVSLTVLTPREGRQIRMSLTFVGEDQVPVGMQHLDARHFRLDGGEEARDIWFDEQWRILRVEIPSKGYLAEREKMD